MTILDDRDASTWVEVCPLDALQPDRGVCALVGGRAVAVFRLSGSGELRALDNVDPFTGASVLSRGLVGTTQVDGLPTTYVASPLKKQRFDLLTGRCLDADGVAVAVHPVVARDGTVHVATPTL
jgi:nitrite reductase (NADH) small subunit